MATVKRSIKWFLTQALLIFVGSFLWNLISGKDVYTALKEAFAVLLIGSLAWAVAEAAYNYQTK